jgi:hypothetical protein
MQETQSAPERPTPDLERRPITLEEYLALTPEKLELLGGYLISGPDYPEERRNLLLLLLVNEGLLQAVRLAPPERWRAALRQVYGEP